MGYLEGRDLLVAKAMIQSAKDYQKGSDPSALLKDWWLVSYSGPADYNETFASLLKGRPRLRLPNEPLIPKQQSLLSAFLTDLSNLTKPPKPNYFRELIEEKKAHGEVRVLDLMGYGDVLSYLEVSGCAVALTDRRRREDKDRQGYTFIPGDLRLPSTWRKVRRLAKKDGKFDVVLCRPAGGLLFLPKEALYYSYFLDNVINLLAEDGVFLTQFDPDMYPVVEEGARRINMTTSMRAQCDYRDSTFMLSMSRVNSDSSAL